MARLVALTNGSPHSWIVLNALVEVYGPLTVLVEPAESKKELIRKRIKRQGFVTVAGQVGFVLLQKLMAKGCQRRIREILENEKANPEPNPACKRVDIPSVNAEETRAMLSYLRPQVIVVFGTRIIGKETLKAITVPLINFHSGINPKYRGQAGGYWALAMGDPENAGVTVHLVDQGVDTGDVLYQGRITTTKADSFTTYFYLQAAAIRPLAIKAVADALNGTLKPFRPELPSRQFYHPTLWFYLWTGLTKGVW